MKMPDIQAEHHIVFHRISKIKFMGTNSIGFYSDPE